MTNCTYKSARAARAIARITEALKGERMTAKQLAAATCMSISSAQNYLTHLRAEPRRVRICGYEPGIGPTPPIYALGSAPDAKRTPKRAAADRFKALKADPVGYQKSLAMRRLCRLRRASANKPQTWLSALM